MWNLLPIYADDGSLVDQDISGGVAQEIDWAIGNANGVLAHIKETGTYVQVSFDISSKLWTSAPVPPPI